MPITTPSRNCRRVVEIWDWFALHVWLLSTSFATIFVILTFLEELTMLEELVANGKWAKGTVAAVLGLLYYVTIALRQLDGGRRYGWEQEAYEKELTTRIETEEKCILLAKGYDAPVPALESYTWPFQTSHDNGGGMVDAMHSSPHRYTGYGSNPYGTPSHHAVDGRLGTPLGRGSPDKMI
jgi:hypothetical protein